MAFGKAKPAAKPRAKRAGLEDFDAVGLDPDEGSAKGSKKSLAEQLSDLDGEFQAILYPEMRSSGAKSIDAILGGGIPAGSFVEWVSESGLGKSTGCLFACSAFAQRGERTAILDSEHGINGSQIEGMRLTPYLYHKEHNPDGIFHVYQPKHIEAAARCMTGLVNLPDPPKLVVIDSITAMVPQKLIEEDLENITPFLVARMQQAFLLKFKGICRERGVSVIFVNQLRNKSRGKFMFVEDSAGGKALEYYCDIRIRMRKEEDILHRINTIGASGRGVETPCGVQVQVWSFKCRCAPPFVSVPMSIIFGKGISNLSTYREYLTATGLAKRAGAWYTITLPGLPEAKVQGKEGLGGWARDNCDALDAYMEAHGGLLSIGSQEAPMSEDEAQEAGVPLPTEEVVPELDVEGLDAVGVGSEPEVSEEPADEQPEPAGGQPEPADTI